MREAKISDVFISFQGEGPYTGMRQLFIRFFGCSFNCVYCDERPTSYKMFTSFALLDKILEYTEPYYSISLTGGEPLEQVEFLEEFLPVLREKVKKPIYLETNGILYQNLDKIINLVDIIAMDIKLPSSTNREAEWEAHKKFFEIAESKKVFVKMIVTNKTNLEDIEKIKEVIKGNDAKIPLILQVVDPIGDVKKPSDGLVLEFQRLLSSNGLGAGIMKQYHKAVGIK